MSDSPMTLVCEALAAVANSMSPHQFQSFLGGMLANVVGNMSERYWREFKKIKPCGIIGCDCHKTIVPTTMKALEVIREDHRSHMEKTEGFTE